VQSTPALPRPRQSGITMALDRLYGLIDQEFEKIADYVDIVEIGWGLPLVWKEEAISSRIKFYKGLGVKVSVSGTLIEYSVYQNELEQMLSRVSRLGFDIVEVSDGIIDLTHEQKARLARLVKSKGFECLYAVGKKDPAGQLSVPETVADIEAGLNVYPLKIVLEGRERGRGVGIYDENGDVKWNTLRAITARVDHSKIIFEAPSEAQQAALISEFGSGVNLGNVSLNSIAALQSERMGLRFDTFGVNKPVDISAGGPSIKFILFVIRHYQPIDQKEIVSITQLPKRTVQKAIEYLKTNKLVTEHPNFEDRRSKIYRTPTATPVRKPSR
jgi:phosphosulfolactate synthase